MSETAEIAKAIKETAKLGEKSLEIAEKASGFLAKVFKEPIAEFGGLITDKLRFVRWKRMVAMSDEINQILEKKGVKETKAVPPKLALPIFENSSLEEDPDIQHLWNHLLANAMDPSFNDEIRYGFIEMIKNITGKEALLLDHFYKILEQENRLSPLDKIFQCSLKKEQLMQLLGITSDQYALAANNLMRMQLIGPAILSPGGMSIGSELVTIYKGIDVITLTPLGVKFVEACIR